MQDLDVKWILHLPKFRQGAKSPQKRIYCVPAQETAKHRAKFGWRLVSDVTAVMEGKTRNPLKFAGVPQTPEPISVASVIFSQCLNDNRKMKCNIRTVTYS